MSPSGPRRHCSKPLIRTKFPVNPGSRTRSRQRPVIFGLGATQNKAIHVDEQVGTGREEALDGIRDGGPSDGRRAAVDLEGSVLCEK